jgi:hypothetical protein
MHLIKYNIDTADPNIYINKLDLIAFMSVWGNEKEIVLLNFYGYIKDKDFSENDFPPKMTIEEFTKSIESLKLVNIKDWLFKPKVIGLK